MPNLENTYIKNIQISELKNKHVKRQKGEMNIGKMI